MDGTAYVEHMILLTQRKQEALAYLCRCLESDEEHNQSSKQKWYFDQKNKVEKAILKVDIEFLDAYHHLLAQEKVAHLDELPKEKFATIALLQQEISKIQTLEKRIEAGENTLLEASKHMAPRAIAAYKKLKK
ncbi:MAG: hypothetical protein JXO44_15225 [Clostridia bacterium]|nr:hypothetical protein [Clostridia bacterium]